MHVAEAFWVHLRAALQNRMDPSYGLSRPFSASAKPTSTEPLSVSTLARNFHVLSQKAQELGAVLKSLGGIFTWRHPDRTLLSLFLFTWGSIYPHFFLVYPVLYVLIFMSNKYLQKHPLKPMVVPADKEIGFDDGSMSIHALYYIQNDMFGWLWQFEDNNGTVSEIRSSTGNLFHEVENLLDDHDLEDDNSQTASLLKNMEDIQATTTKIMRFIYGIESKINSYCSFVNDMESTKLYLKMFTSVTLAIVLGPYIPWRVVFILTVWIVMLITHPNRKDFISTIITQNKDVNTVNRKCKSDTSIFASSNIIIDEPQVIKRVQIYELQQQSMTSCGKYQTSKYTTNVFNLNDEQRRQRKLPRFALSLNEIKPPTKWQFKFNSRWQIDKINSWVKELDIQNELDINADGWVYDLTGEFRRRRLTRECHIENI